MGFGFNLFFILIFLPGSILLLVLAAVSGKRIFSKILAAGWMGMLGLIVLSIVIRSLFATVELEKEDYYGSYVIDRNQFPGRQADWQFNTFRFDIMRDDRIAFYVMNEGEVVQTYTGDISTVKPYSSHRLVLHMRRPTHHILSSNPTVYRRGRHFYLVFESPRFGNVFFAQGKWQPLEK